SRSALLHSSELSAQVAPKKQLGGILPARTQHCHFNSYGTLVRGLPVVGHMQCDGGSATASHASRKKALTRLQSREPPCSPLPRRMPPRGNMSDPPQGSPEAPWPDGRGRGLY